MSKSKLCLDIYLEIGNDGDYKKSRLIVLDIFLHEQFKHHTQIKLKSLSAVFECS